MKRVLLIKEFIPKYDQEFYQKIGNEKYEFFVTKEEKSSSDLNTKIKQKESFKTVNIKIVRLGSFVFMPGIQKVINNINPDLIIFPSNPRHILNIPLIIINKILYKRRINTWSMYHRIGGDKFFSSLLHYFNGALSIRNMSYSNIGLQKQLERRIPKKKIDVIGTAIDEKKIFESKGNLKNFDKESFLKKYNIENCLILLQVMRLTAIKKPHIFLELIKKLVQKEKKIKLVLIGGGELEQDLKRLFIKANLLEFVLFLGPIYDENELAKWFAVSNIFVVPTCIGLSAHHSFCYGLPVVTDNSRKNQASEFDILKDRWNCLLYKEGCIDSFCEKILELKNDIELYNELSHNCISTIKDTHSLENKAINFLQSIEQTFN